MHNKILAQKPKKISRNISLQILKFSTKKTVNLGKETIFRKENMGLSASQARLLSITARLSTNELQSQLLANSKVRLADQTSRASEEYIEALNTTKLMYTTYDSAGNATQMNLTPALMYEYSDLKNQYGISNTSGQLLVNSTDAMNFESSANLNEFVGKYGVPLADNPAYSTALTGIYGSEYNTYYDTANNQAKTDFGGLAVINWLDQANSSMTAAQYDAWASKADAILNSKIGTESGTYGALVQKLTNIPENPGDEPKLPVEPIKPEVEEMPKFGELATAYNGQACYTDVQASSSGILHMEHNLCYLIWVANGLGVDSNGNRGTITNSDRTISITPDGTQTNNSLYSSGHSHNSATQTAANELCEAFKTATSGENGKYKYQCVQDIMQQIIDLYCDVINYLHLNNSSRVGDYTITSTASSANVNDLYNRWQQIYADLAGLEAKGTQEYTENVYDPAMKDYLAEKAAYDAEVAVFPEKHKVWQDAWNAIELWAENNKAAYNNYWTTLEDLPIPQIPDPEDARTEWYVNLWHRMNGASDFKSQEGTDGRYYKKLDDNLLNSQEWLQFALEHGVVTLEQVQFVEDAEDDTGLEYSKWKSTSFGACADIIQVDDEVAIARAEANYTKKLNEIQAKDKKYDTDIKKLDTEHTALQTEYDSIKEVISKNVDRSFKAFS